ncbi:cyclin D2 [Ectocarpus siliculosus]|uniref:Cyclin D2 n=1 Tax=Ectocarpus siliculosus TaxID=2880 RepID=D7FHG2_ECTSI|nr:cyclin D2 [Ectocarpus siliculosus]|eukprot:CBJ28524.1 cyclin D2 [Ectocarpus siliculosus]
MTSPQAGWRRSPDPVFTTPRAASEVSLWRNRLPVAVNENYPGVSNLEPWLDEIIGVSSDRRNTRAAAPGPAITATPASCRRVLANAWASFERADPARDTTPRGTSQATALSLFALNPVLAETRETLQPERANLVQPSSEHSRRPPTPPARQPAAEPLQGAIALSTEEADSMLAHTFLKQERQSDNVLMGFYMLRGRQPQLFSAFTSGIVDIATGLTAGAGVAPSHPVAADTVALAIINLARFVATTAEEGIADDNRDLLPLVCLLMAQKLEDNGPDSLLSAMLTVCNVGDPDHTATKKRVARLEAKVCASLKWALYAVTPTTFGHLFLARALSEGALAGGQSQVRELTTVTSLRWVQLGYLSEFKPSELAAAAMFCAVLRERDFQEARQVNEATRSGVVDLESSRFWGLYREEDSHNAVPTIMDAIDAAGVGMGADDRGTGAAQRYIDGAADKDEGSGTAYGCNDSDTEGPTPPPTREPGEALEAFFTDDQQVSRAVSRSGNTSSPDRQDMDEPENGSGKSTTCSARSIIGERTPCTTGGMTAPSREFATASHFSPILLDDRYTTAMSAGASPSPSEHTLGVLGHDRGSDVEISAGTPPSAGFVTLTTGSTQPAAVRISPSQAQADPDVPGATARIKSVGLNEGPFEIIGGDDGGSDDVSDDNNTLGLPQVEVIPGNNSTNEVAEWDVGVEMTMEEAGELLLQQRPHLVPAPAMVDGGYSHLAPGLSHVEPRDGDTEMRWERAAMRRLDDGVKAFQRQEKRQGVAPLVFWGEGGVLLPVVPPAQVDARTSPPAVDSNSTDDTIEWKREVERQLEEAGKLLRQQNLHLVTAVAVGSHALLRPEDVYPPLFHTNGNQDDAPASQHAATTALLRPDAFTGAFQCQEEGNADSAPPGSSRRTFYPLLFHTNGSQDDAPASQHTTATALLRPDAFAGEFQS